MANLRDKLKKAFFLGGFSFLLLVIFIIDAVLGHGTIDVEGGLVSIVRDLLKGI